MTPPGSAEDLRGLAQRVDALDYYEILGVEPGATPRAIQLAFHQASRRAHPDARRDQPAEVRRAAERVARRVTEAYTVLRNPQRRRVYDERRARGQHRIQLAEAQSAVRERSRRDGEATTPQARRFLQAARADLDRGDLNAAVRNLQTALTYEPGNAALRTLLEETRARR